MSVLSLVDVRQTVSGCSPLLTVAVPVVATVFRTVLPLHPVAPMPSMPPPTLVAILPVLTPVLIILSECGCCSNCMSVGIQRESKLAQAEHEDESQCDTYSLGQVFVSFLVTVAIVPRGSVAIEGSFFIHRHDESNKL